MISVTIKKRMLAFLFIAATLFLSACDEELNEGVCTTNMGLESGEYQSATICYPCEMGDEEYPAVAVSGGYSNTKEQMIDYAETLVADDFIVIGVTPKGNYTTNHTYFRRALSEAFKKLKTQNADPQSPIYGKVDVDRLAQVGYSMGGGAALLNAQGDEGDIKTTVAISPFYPGVKPESLNNVTSPAMLITGTADMVAFPSYVEKMRDSMLSGDYSRVVFSNFQGLSHLDAVKGMGSAEKHARILEYTRAFLKSELMNDSDSESVIAGDIQAQHEAEGWFKEYDVFEAH